MGQMGQNGALCLKIWSRFVSKKMCFWTVLDHLGAILVHFEQNLKIENFSTFLTILGNFGPFWGILGPFWTLFGPFLDPKMASGASGEPTKIGQKGVKRP